MSQGQESTKTYKLSTHKSHHQSAVQTEPQERKPKRRRERKGKRKGKAQEQLLNKMGHGENTRGREEEGEHEQASEAMSQRHVEGTGGGEGTTTVEEEYHQNTRKPNERVKEGCEQKNTTSKTKEHSTSHI